MASKPTEAEYRVIGLFAFGLFIMLLVMAMFPDNPHHIKTAIVGGYLLLMSGAISVVRRRHRG